MKYMGIDYGAKWVGVAISDAGGTIAFPKTTLPNDTHLKVSLGDLIKKEHVDVVVVGDTLAINGEKNEISDDAEQFIKDLKGFITVPVSPAFEAWSSSEAARDHQGRFRSRAV